MLRFFSLFIVIAFTPVASSAQTQEVADVPPPVVLELFTSQSCGFCPPADALIGQMAQQQSIIAMSCHVDYFGVSQNSLGKSFCTRRQNEYNRIIGTGPRYTPQLVVNGHIDMIGYQTGKVSAAVLKARAEKVLPISIVDGGAGAYSFSLPTIDVAGKEIRLWLAVYDVPKTLSMVEGSNFGKKLTYYNVISRIDDLGVWDGRALTQSAQIGLTNQNAGLAVIAQNVQTGHIIAAGDLKKPVVTPVAAVK
jgi:hypothetical protein